MAQVPTAPHRYVLPEMSPETGFAVSHLFTGEMTVLDMVKYENDWNLPPGTGDAILRQIVPRERIIADYNHRPG